MKKSSTQRRILYTVLIIIAILLVAAGIRIYQDVLSSNVREEASGKYLYCYTGLSVAEQQERILSQKVLKHPDVLFRILKLTGYDVLIKPGRYKLKQGMSNLELLKVIVSGRQEPFDIVLKQATRVHDVAAFFGKQLEADSNTIEMLLTSNIPMDSLGLDTANAIQLFIPDTYNFYWNTSAEKLIAKMIKAYKHFWDSTRIQKASQLGMTPAQVGTLASIIQKETNKTDEMPLIAGVYLNRLHKGMPLQADPTIVFAMNDPSIRRVGGEMLHEPSPYNTYINTGLPPGPIGLPSVQAIDAVLNKTTHRYLYFCASEDFSGYHRFAETFAMHQQNARKYQRALNRKGIK